MLNFPQLWIVSGAIDVGCLFPAQCNASTALSSTSCPRCHLLKWPSTYGRHTGFALLHSISCPHSRLSSGEDLDPSECFFESQQHKQDCLLLETFTSGYFVCLVYWLGEQSNRSIACSRVNNRSDLLQMGTLDGSFKVFRTQRTCQKAIRQLSQMHRHIASSPTPATRRIFPAEYGQPV